MRRLRLLSMPLTVMLCSPAQAKACAYLLLSVPLTVMLVGCAKFPEQPPVPISRDRLVITLTYAAPIEPNFYYFIAIDDDGDPLTGPLPATTRPWGNGWGVPQSEIPPSRIRYFVEIRNRQAGTFRIDLFQPPFTTTFLGVPLEFINLQPNQIRVTLDLRQVFSDFPDRPQRIELNFISVDELKLDPTDNTPREGFDALGATGNDFVSIPLTSTQTFRNGEGFIRETSGDSRIDALDLTDWEVRVVRGE